MLLLIVVQPFYCRDGYSTIGSRQISVFEKLWGNAVSSAGNTGACKAFALGVSDCIRILPQCRKERQSQGCPSPNVFALLYGAVNILSLIGSNYVNIGNLW